MTNSLNLSGPDGVAVITAPIGFTVSSPLSTLDGAVTATGELTVEPLAGGALAGVGAGGVLTPVTTGTGLSLVDGVLSVSGGGGGGTVTSVGLSAPSIFTVSGSPVTTSGTLTIALAAQSGPLVFAGPPTGSGAPSFQALSAVLDAAFGNTQGSILYRGASGWAGLGPDTEGYVLQTGGPGANPSWVAPSGGGGGWAFSSTSLTATSGQQIIATGASGQTITLPASPIIGAFVAIRVELLGAFANRVTVAGNGNLITGALFSNQSSIGLGLDGQEAWFVFDGTVWRATSPGGPTLLCPKVADFTWTNQGTATATDTATGLRMYDPNNGQPSQRILSKPVSGTFTQLTCLVQKSGAQGNYTNNGPVILDLSGKFVIMFEQAPSSWWVGYFNSPTSNNSFPVNGATKLGATSWWRYVVVGSVLGFQFGENPTNFNSQFQTSPAAFLSSLASVGIAVDGGGAGAVVTTFPHFHQE